jgi:hypothetical protein
MIQTRWLKGGMGDEQYEAMLESTREQLPRDGPGSRR